MALRDLLARPLAVMGRTSDIVSVSQYLQGVPWAGDPNALSYPLAVALVPTVFACVTKLGQDIAALPVRFYYERGEERVEVQRDPGNIVDVWQSANPVDSGYELRRDLEMSKDTNGTGFLYLERFTPPDKPQKGPPREVWSIPGNTIEVTPGPRRTVAWYQLKMRGGLGERYQGTSIVLFRHHNPNANPLEPSPLGLSPLSACRLQYEARYGMSKFQSQFYEKGAVGNMVLSVKDGSVRADAQVKAAQEAWVRRYSGPSKVGVPVFLQGMELVQQSMTIKDMQFMEAMQMTDADICRVFGVPPVLLGIKEGGGLSDAGATTDTLLYYENAVKPRTTLFDKVMTEKFCPLFGTNIVCETDYSGVLALQAQKLEQAKTLVILSGGPVLTPNEARKAIGEQPLEDEGADEMREPPAPAGAAPAPEAEPKPAPGRDEQQPGDDDAEAALTPRRGLKLGAGDTLRRLRDADLVRYERQVAAMVRARFTRQEQETLARLGGLPTSTDGALRAPVGMARLGAMDDAQDMDDAQALFERLVAERGLAAADEVAAEVVLEVQRGRVNNAIRTRVATMVKHIDETTRAALAEAISTVQATGGSYADIVATVHDVFEGRRANAMTIARTETAWAYNMAAAEVWQQAGVEQKEWLTVGDDEVRESHRACEAEGAIPMGAAFANGLQYPGDPAGDAGETINCRCVLQPVLAPVDSLARFFKPQRGGNRLAHLFAPANGNGAAH